ncbi:MAG TPA: TPM domain-containing protein [Longimicrobium sp.]|nr:TPM domain-containing protein [Longimicrobium sp.]
MNELERFTHVFAFQAPPARMIRIAAAVALLFATPAPAQQLTPTPGCTVPLPTSIGWVNDFAGVLADSTEARLTEVITEVQERSLGEIVVVTLPSLYGCTDRDMAMRIGQEWGVGYEGPPEDPRTNSGVVVLVAPVEQKGRIATGLGTMQWMSDQDAGRILINIMFPAYRSGDFDTGTLLGVQALARRYADHFGFTLQSVPPQ